MGTIDREHAQEFSEALDRIGEGWYRQAVVAGKLGIPESLGLSWDEWCEKYMPRLKLAIKQRREAVLELHEEGQKRREIASTLGLSKGTVQRDLEDAGKVKKQTLAPNGPNGAEDTSKPKCAKAALAPNGPNGAEDANPKVAENRADRIGRDNKAEQKRAERTEREDAAPAPPAPDIRKGTLSKALADVTDVDLVFTDPPYPREFLPVWSELAEWAASALKPGALLVAYSGQYHLPEVLHRLSEHLTYQWLGWVSTTGPAVSVHQRPISSMGKPLLVFSNGKLKAPYNTRRFMDVAQSAGRTRELHTWQQDEAPAAYWIDALSERSELVVDPFVGAGTFAVVAKTLERRFIGCDSDATAVKTTQRRLDA